ncbi:hypothetical protein ANN_03980 [Periplaneta americana]|uniref:Tc1-like transposase DDE domain-containing protein n=1 Tax=Periplaneta americana TaxID=6978 RepID=A0ABQ8T7A9_PERAM|nr:hypothetical protein ANN_03980 [Periplaneta americana]
MRFMRKTAGYSLLDHHRNVDILKELKIDSIVHYLQQYRLQWQTDVKRRIALDGPGRFCRIVNDELRDADIVRLEWPACSPDMNPIQQAWSRSKQAVFGRPDGPRNRRDLCRIGIEEWDNLDQQWLNELKDGKMSPGSSTESYPAFAHIGLRKTPEKKPHSSNLPQPGFEPGPPGFAARRADRYSTDMDCVCMNYT